MTVPYRDESISILGVLLSQVLKLVKVLFWIWGKLLREEIVLSCFRAKIHIDLRWKVNRVFWYMHYFSVQCNEIQLLFCAFLSLSLMCDGRTPNSIPISILLKQGTTHPNPNFISLSGLRTHQSLDSSNKNHDAQVLKGGLSQPQNPIGWWQIASRFSIDVLFSSTSSCVTLTLTLTWEWAQNATQAWDKPSCVFPLVSI